MSGGIRQPSRRIIDREDRRGTLGGAAGFTDGRGGHPAGVRLTLALFAVGLAVAVLIYAASGGRIVFLPLLLILPLGLLFARRR